MNMADDPLVSIITPVKNGEKHLEETICSVLSQTYSNIEYIIIDGESEDNTHNIIRKYESYINNWISELDNGIYQAMNKGIAMSKGEIIGIINSDDILEKETVEIVVNAHKENPSDIYCGKMIRFREIAGVEVSKEVSTDLSQLHKTMSVFHPATFITAKLYQTIGLYDESYCIAADYDFILRAKQANCSIHLIEKVLCRFRTSGGVSSMNCRSYAEAARIHKEHHTGNYMYMKKMHLKCIIKTGMKKFIYTLAQALGMRKKIDRLVKKRWEH